MLSVSNHDTHTTAPLSSTATEAAKFNQRAVQLHPSHYSRLDHLVEATESKSLRQFAAEKITPVISYVGSLDHLVDFRTTSNISELIDAVDQLAFYQSFTEHKENICLNDIIEYLLREVSIFAYKDENELFLSGYWSDESNHVVVRNKFYITKLECKNAQDKFLSTDSPRLQSFHWQVDGQTLPIPRHLLHYFATVQCNVDNILDPQLSELVFNSVCLISLLSLSQTVNKKILDISHSGVTRPQLKLSVAESAQTTVGFYQRADNLKLLQTLTAAYDSGLLDRPIYETLLFSVMSRSPMLLEVKGDFTYQTMNAHYEKNRISRDITFEFLQPLSEKYKQTKASQQKFKLQKNTSIDSAKTANVLNIEQEMNNACNREDLELITRTRIEAKNAYANALRKVKLDAEYFQIIESCIKYNKLFENFIQPSKIAENTKCFVFNINSDLHNQSRLMVRKSPSMVALAVLRLTNENDSAISNQWIISCLLFELLNSNVAAAAAALIPESFTPYFPPNNENRMFNEMVTANKNPKPKKRQTAVKELLKSLETRVEVHKHSQAWAKEISELKTKLQFWQQAHS